MQFQDKGAWIFKSDYAIFEWQIQPLDRFGQIIISFSRFYTISINTTHAYELDYSPRMPYLDLFHYNIMYVSASTKLDLNLSEWSIPINDQKPGDMLLLMRVLERRLVYWAICD